MPAPHDCTACPLHCYRTKVVNGIIVGDDPQLMVVGEGPGVAEDTQGRPFIGPSGALLAQELRLRGITSYVLTNATRCYPSEDKKESELAAGLAACAQYLDQDVEAIKPKVILALGVWAIKALGIDDPISTVLCHVIEGRHGIPVVPSYHPAAFMRDAGSIHLFEIAVYKAMRVVNDLSPGDRWAPQLITANGLYDSIYGGDTSAD